MTLTAQKALLQRAADHIGKGSQLQAGSSGHRPFNDINDVLNEYGYEITKKTNLSIDEQIDKTEILSRRKALVRRNVRAKIKEVTETLIQNGICKIEGNDDEVQEVVIHFENLGFSTQNNWIEIQWPITQD